MTLHGKNLIGAESSSQGSSSFAAVDPTTGNELDPPFLEATETEIDRALQLSASAFEPYSQPAPNERAAFLRAIATEIENLGDELLERARLETALGLERLRNERARTTAQLRMFATLIDEGSWIGARIDRGDPHRQPMPKPDIRRMLVPLGPVVVFGASNFPLAFSVAGGDTASALAAACPVVVKAHPAHPGTSELVGGAILRAAAATKMPGGVFSMLHGRSPELSVALVKHPQTAAVGFTGSLRAGRALFDAAVGRPRPIPVYAEMGSTNPLFLLPAAIETRGKQIAQGLRDSVMLGVGQFCTKPGIAVAIDTQATREFSQSITSLLQAAPGGPLLHKGIHESFVRAIEQTKGVPGVRASSASSVAGGMQAVPTLFSTDAQTFLKSEQLSQEIFGPAMVLVMAASKEQMLQIARNLEGHLTATLHGTEEDLHQFSDLVAVLRNKVGRLIFNGFPTGVEVCASMQHGGPYPATTDSRTTSVGTAAIERFVRPVCYQNFPQHALPPELQEHNPRNIWRLVDDQWTRE